MGWGPNSSADHDWSSDRPTKPYKYSKEELKAISAGEKALFGSMIGFILLMFLGCYLDSFGLVFGGLLLWGYGSLSIGMCVEEYTLRKLKHAGRNKKRKS